MGDLSSKRILVVEDEDLIRRILTETLADEGYLVVEASTADEAAELLVKAQDGFAAVITDIHTPGMRDGIEVGRCAHEQDPDIAVIYVTGRPDAMQAVGGLAPKDAFLRKPYLPSQILALLRTLDR